MKKSVLTKTCSLLMALLMLLFAGAVTAEGLPTDGDAFSGSDTKKENVIDYSADFLLGGSTDKVNESADGVLTVTTADGLSFRYSDTSNIIYLTQNVIYSGEIGDQLLKDPASTFARWIEAGMHLLLLNTEVTLYIYDDGINSLSSYIGNASNLTEEDADQIADMLKTKYSVDFVYGILGENVWFVGDCRASEGVIELYTWVGGHQLNGIAFLEDGVALTDVYAVLNNLTISAE